jgi:glycosyltransferase involved in cell wall biosynthesis
MLNKKTVAVIVPAFNEEYQIGMVIESMPDFVDRIVVIDDHSSDDTANVVSRFLFRNTRDYSNDAIGERVIEPNRYNKAEVVLQTNRKREIRRFAPFRILNRTPEKDRIILIQHERNAGVGAAVANGYKWCLDNNIDCIAKMDGDGQMDPSELKSICLPVVNGLADYCKGNRLMHLSAHDIIPRNRYLGNAVLSILTKIASGYWKISDTQTAYSAISSKALSRIRIYDLYPTYGYPNDILIKLNISNCKVHEVPIKPVYQIGEHSKMKILKVIPKISWLLFKGFFIRMREKYLIRDFHPLFILYHLAFILIIISIPFLVKVLRLAILSQPANPVTVLAFVFLFISGFQSLLFAMWMDIQNNESLYTK